ncbi:PaaI family thioesterase [Noviherbaspirillum sp.]|uniref:PaaI family thioesterase n=1 Tax=Noviherbaspirillum sp. TaxID=1926288 RepID=UPI002FDF6BAB
MRNEIIWFGFQGAFEKPGTAIITFSRMEAGALGGGGTKAVNGGVIAAGFDAAFVLAGLGQYDTDVVVTLDLSVQFLNLAIASPSLAFEAQVVRSAKSFCFAHGVLRDRANPGGPAFSLAKAMVAPAR